MLFPCDGLSLLLLVNSHVCHQCYFHLVQNSLGLCVCVRVSVRCSLAQMGQWHDKAQQDVFSKSALTPPSTFYGAEGGGCTKLLMLLL